MIKHNIGYELKINGFTIEGEAEYTLKEGYVTEWKLTNYHYDDESIPVFNEVEDDLWTGFLNQIIRLDTDIWYSINDLLDLGSKMAVNVTYNTGYDPVVTKKAHLLCKWGEFQVYEEFVPITCEKNITECHKGYGQGCFYTKHLDTGCDTVEDAVEYLYNTYGILEDA